MTIVNTFQKLLDSSKGIPNKIWVDQGSEFYNSSLKKWLEDNDIKMYSTYNEGKSFAAKRFIRTLKNKNTITYHRTIKIKPIDFKKLILTKKLLNLKLVIILEYQKKKNYLLKDMLLIDQKKFLELAKLKIQFHEHILLVI